MSTPVSRPMFVNYFSPFAPWCESIIKDDSCLSTLGNDGSQCCVSKNIILSETGDASIMQSSDVPMLDSGSAGNKIVTWLDIVVSVYNDRSIEYDRKSSEGGTAEGLVAVSESKIPVELANGKVWQPSSESWDCDFYLHQWAFPGTWGAGM